MYNMNIAVIGAGNGGQAMAAYLALKGCKVNLYNRSYKKLEPIIKNDGIYLNGAIDGFGRLNIVTTDIAEAIDGMEIIMIVTPAVAHREIARKLSLYLEDGQKIILNPGRTGGALEFYNILKTNNCSADVIISEAQTFVFASRVVGPARAKIFGVKNHVTIAAFPSDRTRELIDNIIDFLPQFSPVENVLKTSFDNIGAIFHPAPLLLNMAWVETTEGCFENYKEGISPSVCKVIKKMDLERMRVARGFNIDPLSAEDWLRLSYNASGKNLNEMLINNSQYQGISAPCTLDHRYVLEDVPMSLVPISSFAKMCNVDTPTIDLIIELAETVYDRNFRLEGRTIESLGISNLTPNEILNLVNYGSIDEVRVHPALNRRLVKRINKIDNIVFGKFNSYQKEVE
ncbi:MAG: NAD/NADP octopine/nopaline dehydrogenase family protein [bacterium]